MIFGLLRAGVSAAMVNVFVVSRRGMGWARGYLATLAVVWLVSFQFQGFLKGAIGTLLFSLAASVVLIGLLGRYRVSSKVSQWKIFSSHGYSGKTVTESLEYWLLFLLLIEVAVFVLRLLRQI